MKKIIICLTFLILISGCGKKEEVINGVVNNNEGVINEQTISDYKIDNVSIIYDKGVSTYTAFINNLSSDKKIINNFKVILKNETGNVITTLDGPKMEIEANDKFIVTITSDIDLSEVASASYVIE